MPALPPHLEAMRERIERHAIDFGLDFFDVVFEVVSYDELNMIAAYGGFPTRYPHWKFGMEYERLSKSYSYGLSKIYELVINNDPSYAYLMASNMDVDQKLVMSHVYGHVDFFKNNFAFGHTNRKMMDTMANHGTKIRRFIDRYGLEKVEAFVDRCLSIDNLIDRQSPYIKRREDKRSASPSDLERDDRSPDVPRLRVERSYMNQYINPPQFVEEQRKRLEIERAQSRKFPERPERDVLQFVMEHGPLENWEQDVLAMIREEAYYFAPQGQTKVMNEGWACVVGDTPVFTTRGMVPMRELVLSTGARAVSDGHDVRGVYDHHVIADHATIELRTRRGFVLEGSTNHRVLLADGTTWKRLDELTVGDALTVAAGGVWPSENVAIDYTPPTRVSLQDVADRVGVSLWTVLRHRAGRNVRETSAIAEALVADEAAANQDLPQALAKRVPIRIPKVVDAQLAAFLGYLVGDGHVSKVKRNVGLTTADAPQAEAFAALGSELFGAHARIVRDGGRLRVLISSEALSDFLTDAIGLTHGFSARVKRIPSIVLRSPASVIASFLRAYFDCDGHAGAQGVILSSMSEGLAREVQLVLLNFGVLSGRRQQNDGCYHVHIAGASAIRFSEQIGFGLVRKQEALKAYIDGHTWFRDEEWTDEVVGLRGGRAPVYDISVDATHRYAAAGLVNHNSYWHTTIMTQKALTDSEVIDYADRHSGTMGVQPGSMNPYKLGLELFRDIEDRWNKGRFGKEYDECDDVRVRREWNTNAGLGREKIFEVRRHYNDVTFIDEFLTRDFAVEQKMFTYEHNKKSGNWEIADREFKAVKEKLLFQLTNFGQPFISVIDGNFENRGELLLKHQHEGVDLRTDYMRDTLTNLQAMWTRPVGLVTRVDERVVLVKFDGKDFSEAEIESEP